MISIQLNLFHVGAMLFGILSVVVQIELDCSNDPTTQPIPGGWPHMVFILALARRSAEISWSCDGNLSLLHLFWERNHTGGLQPSPSIAHLAPCKLS